MDPQSAITRVRIHPQGVLWFSDQNEPFTPIQ